MSEPPTITGSLATISDYWYDQFTEDTTLGLNAVYYGDQTKIPFAKTLCVEPMVKNNELRASMASRRIDNVPQVALIVYFGPVNNDQQNSRESLLLGESVESFVHARPKAGGLVIHCYVTSIEAGYIERNNGVLMRACRLVIEHKTYTVLPS